MLTCSTELSEIEKKRELYSNDVYFRDAFQDLQALIPEWMEKMLSGHASIILKPEAIVNRKAHLCIEFLMQHGFIPVAQKRFQFNRHLIRDLWRFQFNAATRERLDILDMWWKTTDVLYVAFKLNPEYNHHNPALSASTQLTFLKGHSNPERHRDGELRKFLDQKIIMLNYMHSTDEPADFVRDLWVIFDPQERIELVWNITRWLNIENEIQATIQELYTETDYVDVSFDTALNDLQTQLANFAWSDQQIHEVKKSVDQILTGEVQDWKSILTWAEQLWIRISDWTRIIIGAKLSRLTYNNQWPVIPSILRNKS